MSAAVASSNRQRLRQIALGAAYLIGIAVARQVVRAFIDNPMTSVMITAVVVSFVTGYAGLRAEEGGAPARRRALTAAALTALPVIAAIAVARLLGARLPIAPPGMSALFGVAEAIAIGYVAETWLHGLPMLYAERAGVPNALAVAYAVAAGVGVQIFAGPIAPGGVALAVVSGTFFALLWLRTGDAWAPVTAHVVWVWSCDGLLRGDLFDLGPEAGRLTHALEATGAVAWVATAVFGVLAWGVGTGLIPFSRAPDLVGSARAESPPEDEDPNEEGSEDDEADERR